MGAAKVPLVQEAKVTIEQINAEIAWIRKNREHLAGHAARLIMICEQAREFEARRATGQPATYRAIGPGPHGGGFPCGEH